MKILMLNQVAAPVGGGINQYVMDVAGRLRAGGDTVALVHGRHPASTFSGTGYVFDFLHENAPHGPDVRERLEAILDDFDPDVIQVQSVRNFYLIPWLTARAPTVRFIHNHQLYCSGRDMTWRRPRRICTRAHGTYCRFAHPIHRCGSMNPVTGSIRHSNVTTALGFLKRIDGIQVASPVIRENLIRNGIPEERIQDMPPYAPEPAARRKPVQPARRMILLPGGLARNSGVWLMLRTLRVLPTDVELVFVGGGSQQGRMEATVRSERLGERVRVMGELPPHEVSELFHQAELVILPSRWNDPLGLPGIQAMAHAKPVLAFASPGVSQWLQDGSNGVAVPFPDCKAFTAALKRLIDNPKEMAAMGKRGRRLWEERFQPENHVARLQEYYAKMSLNRSCTTGL